MLNKKFCNFFHEHLFSQPPAQSSYPSRNLEDNLWDTTTFYMRKKNWKRNIVPSHYSRNKSFNLSKVYHVVKHSNLYKAFK